MQIKFKKSIKNWEYHELKFLKKEIETGGQRLNKIVEKRMKELEIEEKTKICPVCYEIINFSGEHYTLTFGPDWLRKRANFDAIDCLSYFIQQLAGLDKIKRQKEIIRENATKEVNHRE